MCLCFCFVLCLCFYGLSAWNKTDDDDDDNYVIQITVIVIYADRCLLEYDSVDQYYSNLLKTHVCYCRLFRRRMQRRCSGRVQWISARSAVARRVWFKCFRWVLQVTKRWFGVIKPACWTIVINHTAATQTDYQNSLCGPCFPVFCSCCLELSEHWYSML